MKNFHSIDLIETTLSENAWKRGWNDSKDRLHSATFWVFEILIGGYLGIAYDTPLAIAGVIVLAVAVIFAATVTAPLRQRDDARKIASQLIPKFEIQYKDSQAFRHPTYRGRNKNMETFYVRVLPQTLTKRVRGCTAYLVDIEKESNGTFLPTNFTGTDSLVLPWSMTPEDKKYLPTDLINGVNRFVDVLWTDKDTGQLILAVPALPNWLSDIVNSQGTYRLTITVISEDADYEKIKLVVTWNGIWDQIKVNAE